MVGKVLAKVSEGDWPVHVQTMRQSTKNTMSKMGHYSLIDGASNLPRAVSATVGRCPNPRSTSSPDLALS